MREKMTEIMFEKFSTPAMTVKNQAPLSLYACGYTTGVVVQSGYGVSFSTPISEGFIVSGVSGKLYLAGKDLTDYLRTILKENGFFPKDDAYF